MTSVGDAKLVESEQPTVITTGATLSVSRNASPSQPIYSSGGAIIRAGTISPNGSQTEPPAGLP